MSRSAFPSPESGMMLDRPVRFENDGGNRRDIGDAACPHGRQHFLAGDPLRPQRPIEKPAAVEEQRRFRLDQALKTLRPHRLPGDGELQRDQQGEGHNPFRQRPPC